MSEDNDHKPDTDEGQETDDQLAGKIKGSARQIWLAGLGAYTKAEDDAGRFFERLVHEGEQLETKTRGVVEKQIKTVEDRVGGVRQRATGTWDRLETMFDERVSGALRRLGIHRRDEIEAMERRIQALEAELHNLQEKVEERSEEE